MEKPIAIDVVRAWLLEDGAWLAYSGRDGAGGFENQGQSLRTYEARTGTSRSVLAEYFPVTNVTTVHAAGGATALVVELTDGMSDAPHLALVDPLRGEVWRRPFARLAVCKGDTLTVTTYREKDWDDHHDNPGHVVKPAGQETHALSRLLSRPVLTNEPLR